MADKKRSKEAVEDGNPEEYLDVEEGIPEEYLDPLQYTLMKDPVILPSSKRVIDRSTIRGHLLSDQTDPFDGSLLTVDMLIPDMVLREKIETSLRTSNWVDTNAEASKRSEENVDPTQDALWIPSKRRRLTLELEQNMELEQNIDLEQNVEMELDRLTLELEHNTATATSYNGKILLRTLSKKDVCSYLSTKFPSVAAALNFTYMESSSKISVERVQLEFWQEIHRQILTKDRRFLHDLIGEEYYRFSHRLGEICDWYRRKTNPLLLLSDMVFFSNVSNPAFSYNTCLESLRAPLDNVYIHSVDLSGAMDPTMLTNAARDCEREVEVFLQKSHTAEDYRLFWHGTTGVSAKLIMKGKLRQSGVSDGSWHDFGVGVYAFSKMLQALSFAVDRSFATDGSPLLLCICLPSEKLKSHMNVDHIVSLCDSDCETMEVELGYADEPVDYQFRDLDGWEQFVKYCWTFGYRPRNTIDQNVFSGILHACDTVQDTKECAKPARDPDSWEQWCFAFDNMLQDKRCKFFFFELDIPNMFTQVARETCDAAIVVEANKE